MAADCQVCVEDSPFMTSAGPCTAKDSPDDRPSMNVLIGQGFQFCRHGGRIHRHQDSTTCAHKLTRTG